MRKFSTQLFFAAIAVSALFNADSAYSMNDEGLLRRGNKTEQVRATETEVEIDLKDVTFIKDLNFDGDKKDKSRRDKNESPLVRIKNQQRQGAKKEFLKTMGWTGLAGVGAGCLACFSPTVGLLFGSGLLYTAKDALGNCAAFCNLTAPSEDLVMVERLNLAEQKLEINKHLMHSFNAKEVTDTIAKARKEIGYGIQGVKSYNKENLDKTLTKIDTILSLPLSFSAPSIQQQFIDILEPHLATYSASVHDAIMTLAHQLHTLSNIRHHGANRAPRKLSYLFLGEAGVGKTATAKMIAGALNRPFCSFNASTLTSFDEFFGFQPVDHYQPVGQMGLFARCFISPDEGLAALDPIIFIDEIHDLLNVDGKTGRKFYSFLKSITEGNEREITDRGLGIKIPIDGATFIFAANENSKKDCASALATRWEVIEFLDLTQDQKRQIAERNFAELCEKYEYQSNDSDTEIITRIVDADGSHGARVLISVIEKYIGFQLARTSLRNQEFSINDFIRSNGGTVRERSNLKLESK
jgi:hypothetical protein